MKQQAIKRMVAVFFVAAMMLTVVGVSLASVNAKPDSSQQEVSAAVSKPIAQVKSWEMVGPGGGGQIQYVYPVPGAEGRIFWLSDMEGLFRSDDNGASFNFVGEEVRTGATYVVVTDPADPEKVYLGTRSGIAISDDGGIHWTHVLTDTAPDAPPDNENIATLVVHGDVVLAGPSWHEDDGQFAWHSDDFSLRTGDRIIYKSEDGGASWAKVPYTNTVGYRQVFDIEFDPIDPNIVFMGADSGVYKSTDMGDTWALVTPPTGLPAGNSRGLAISPDGEFLYASYATEIDAGQPYSETRAFVRRTAVFATHTDDLQTWVKLDDGLGDSVIGGQTTDYWRPTINPRSTTSKHELIIGPLNGDNIGLHYGVFTPTVEVGGAWTITGTWEKIFENRPNELPRVMPGEGRGFNMGVQPKSRHYTWTPADWEEESIWLGDQQSVFRGTPDTPNDWEVMSSIFITKTDNLYAPNYPSAMGYTPHFQHVGVNSTFSYDNMGYENYVVIGEGDNGLLESWDGGETWTQRFFDMENYFPIFSLTDYTPSATHWNGSPVGGFGNWWYFNNIDALTVIPTDPPIMVGGLGFFFGGGLHDMGMLVASELNSMSPEDTWTYLGGSAWERPDWYFSNYWPAFWDPMYWPHNGLPDARFTTLNYNPDDVKQVIVGSHAGLYLIDDIVDRVQNDSGSFYSIGNSDMNSESFRYAAFDPNDTTILYTMSAPYNPSGGGGWGELLGEGSVRRGNWNSDTSMWDWTEIYDRGGAGNSGAHDMQIWDNNGTTTIVLGLPYDTDLGVQTTVQISTDMGETWTEVLDLDGALALGPVKDWYDPSFHHLRFSAVGGYENHIFASLGDHGTEKGYGFYHGEIQADGSVVWEDWTGEYEYGKPYMLYPDARRMHVVETDGEPYLYVSTMGSGVLRRPLFDELTFMPIVFK